MDPVTFKELLDAGEIGLILMDGGHNLTKEQMKLVREKAKEQSKSVLLSLKRKNLSGEQKNTQSKPKVTAENFSNVSTLVKSPKKAANYLAGGTLTRKAVRSEIAPRRSFGEITKNIFERIMGYNDDPVYVTGKIVTFLKKKSKEDKELYREKRDSIREESNIADKRHNDIMQIFISAIEKQKMSEKKIKDSVKKVAPKKEAEVPTKATAPTPSAPTAPAPTTPSPTVTPARPPAPTTAPVTPTPTAPATPVPKPPVSSAGRTAARVATGAAVGAGLATATETVKAKIAGKESAGTSAASYNIMNIGTGEKANKDNVFPLTQMTIADVIALAEKRGKQFNKSGMGKAAGKYQFMPQTLEQVAKSLFGDKWSEQLYSADNQEMLMNKLIQMNAETLQKNGVPISDLTLYAMHFTGSVKQSKAIAVAPDSTPMKEILSAAAQNANPNIAKMTVGEYRAWLKRGNFNLKEITIVPPQKEEVVPVSPQPTIGQKIDEISIDTNGMKRDLKASGQQPSIIINSQNQNTTQRDMLVRPTSEPHPLLGQ